MKIEVNTHREIIIQKELISTAIYRSRIGGDVDFQYFSFPGFYFLLDLATVQHVYVYSCYSYYHEEDSKDYVISDNYEDIINIAERCYEKYYNSLKKDLYIKDSLTIKDNSIVIKYPDKIKTTTTKKETPFYNLIIPDYVKEDKDLKIVNIKYNNFFINYNHIYREKHNYILNLHSKKIIF